MLTIHNSATDQATKEAIQKARTRAKKQHLEGAKATISQQSGLVSAKFGKEGLEWLEFFPNGLSELHKAREASIGKIFSRLVTASEAHLPELTPIFTELRDDWSRLYTAASEGRGAKAVAADGKGVAMMAMKSQLMKNCIEVGVAVFGASRISARSSSNHPGWTIGKWEMAL